MGRRLPAAEKLMIKCVCRPFWGGTFLRGVPVFTISVKLLVRFWSVGVRVEGQKIAGEKKLRESAGRGVVELFDSF